MSRQAIQLCLKSAAVLLVMFGIMGAMAAVPALSGPTNFFFDLAFWPLDGAQSVTAPETRLLCAVSGGLLAGWGVLLFVFAEHVLPRDPGLVRNAIVLSISTWFVLDSSGSIAAGAPLNAFYNIGFLLMFVVPVMALKKRQPEREAV